MTRRLIISGLVLLGINFAIFILPLIGRWFPIAGAAKPEDSDIVVEYMNGIMAVGIAIIAILSIYFWIRWILKG